MRRKLLISGGLLLLAAALLFALFNIREERLAGESAEALSQELEEVREEPAKEPEESIMPLPDTPMPFALVDGQECIGSLHIPVLGLNLPVMLNWDYPLLRKAPCRYTGSLYQDNLIVMAHNYDRHFGSLKDLQLGDEVSFTDVAGRTFDYQVQLVEILKPTDIEKMQAGSWDLTLFTCTKGGKSRVTVRCMRVSGSPDVEGRSIESK